MAFFWIKKMEREFLQFLPPVTEKEDSFKRTIKESSTNSLWQRRRSLFFCFFAEFRSIFFYSCESRRKFWLPIKQNFSGWNAWLFMIFYDISSIKTSQDLKTKLLVVDFYDILKKYTSKILDTETVPFNSKKNQVTIFVKIRKKLFIWNNRFVIIN